MTLDAERLATFPDGYRHLGYVQVTSGREVRRDLPGAHGSELEVLYSLGSARLSGEAFAPASAA